jgi:hypothetical protein
VRFFTDATRSEYALVAAGVTCAVVMAALAPRIPAARYISLIALLAATQWCRAEGIEALERRLNSDCFGLRCNTGETIAASARLSPTAVAPYDLGMIARAKMSKMIADVFARLLVQTERQWWATEPAC